MMRIPCVPCRLSCCCRSREGGIDSCCGSIEEKKKKKGSSRGGRCWLDNGAKERDPPFIQSSMSRSVGAEKK